MITMSTVEPPYFVVLVRSPDGRLGAYEATSDCEREGWSEDAAFMWEFGNYSCDCNRALLAFGGEDVDCGWQFDVINVMTAEGECLPVYEENRPA